MEQQTMDATDRLDIRVTGFGGQGIILAGFILGKAASIFDKRHATLIQAYGPEARGSSCRADLSISTSQIDYPHISQPHLLIALSQDGYMRNIHALAPGGVLLYEEELVHLDQEGVPPIPEGCRPAMIPATRFANEVGNKIIANMVMLGFTAAVTEVASRAAVESAVESSVPHGTETMNLAAFHKGFDYGQKWLIEQGQGSSGNGTGGTLIGRLLR